MSSIPYVCRCGAKGVKLWRKYQTIASATDLYCVDCAGKAQKRDISSVDLFGRVHDKDVGQPCDQIGWLVPAVPTDDGSTFWGYTSVPSERVEWWRALPNREDDHIMTRDAIAARHEVGAWLPDDRAALLFLLDEEMQARRRFECAFMDALKSPRFAWLEQCLSKHRCLDYPGPCEGHGEMKGHGMCNICGGRYGGGLFDPEPTGRERKLLEQIKTLEARIVEMRQRETR